MTDAEKLANENHKLIYAFANKYNIDLDDNEDMYGVLAFGFWKACKTYKGNYRFSTYAYSCMYNQWANWIKAHQTTKRKLDQANKVSLDASDLDDDEWNNQYMVSVDGFEDDLINKHEHINLIKKIWDVANDKQQAYIKLLYKGLNQHEMAKILNVSHQGISERKKSLIKSLEKHGIAFER